MRDCPLLNYVRICAKYKNLLDISTTKVPLLCDPYGKHDMARNVMQTQVPARSKQMTSFRHQEILGLKPASLPIS